MGSKNVFSSSLEKAPLQAAAGRWHQAGAVLVLPVYRAAPVLELSSQCFLPCLLDQLR